MTWVQYLKCVFKISIKTCVQCGSTVKVIACYVSRAASMPTVPSLFSMRASTTPPSVSEFPAS